MFSVCKLTYVTMNQITIFVLPLFELEKMMFLPDDNYIIRWNKCLKLLIDLMKITLESITNWFKQARLKVNGSKTEICLFHQKDHPPIEIPIFDTILTTTTQMNVLGINFDSKLQWQNQVQNTINKSKKALHAIYIIHKFFNKNLLLTIITANYYSIIPQCWCLAPANTQTHPLPTTLFSIVSPIETCHKQLQLSNVICIITLSKPKSNTQANNVIQTCTFTSQSLQLR